MARQYYDSGHALLQQGRYHEALLELGRAENAYRALDARGHPFTQSLPNGISGLATRSCFPALCWQKLGDYTTAITYYETSLINVKVREENASCRRFLDGMAGGSRLLL